jgi:hypothetical protein
VEDVVLIAGTALMFLLGWFLMKRLDRFLDEKMKIRSESRKRPNNSSLSRACIWSEIFLLTNLRKRFPSSHAHVEIVIYDSEQISFPINESDWAQ